MNRNSRKQLSALSGILLLVQPPASPLWAASPGGVSEGIKLWLKADTGVTGSGPITQWNDQSGEGNNASADGNPTLESSDINFNPSVHFDGSGDGFTVSDTHKITGTDDFSVFIVLRSTYGSSVEQLVNSGDADSGRGHFRFQDGNVEIHKNGSGDIITGTTSISGGTPVIAGGIRSGNDFSIFLDGATDAEPTSDSTSFPAANSYLIGRDPSASQDLNGNISEIVIYDSATTEADRNKIESYLAIKYGITLSATDYVTAGGSLLWDSDGANASFHNDVAGIGQDDTSDLDQIQSKSENSGSIVKIKSATSQNDGDFLLWGNNGENQSTWVSTSATSGFMYLGLTTSNRVEWRATETNEIGTVTIEVNEDDLPNFEDPLYIVIDTDDDEDLTDETPAQMTDAGGGTWTYSHNFSNGATNTEGQEFTFAQETSTPLTACGSGLKLWLDASDSTTLHTDAACTSAAPSNNDNVKCWEDKSSNGFDVTEISGDCDEGTSGTQTCGVPTYLTNQFNGEPALEFFRSEKDAMRYDLNGNGDQWTGQHTTFIAFEQQGTPAQYYSFFSNGNPPGDDHFQIDSNGDTPPKFRANGAGGSLIFEEFDNTLKLYTVRATASGSETYADGALKNSNSGTTGRIFEHYRINQNRHGAQFNNAKISEIIVCDSGLGSCPMARINKYLGDKYGRDFSGIDTAYEYSSGHGNDIAGIGFDTSGNTCTPAIVYDNAGSSILSIRIDSPYDTNHNLDLTNQDERLSYGHDNAALTETSSVPSPYTKRLTRVWRADQDDGTGSDNIQDVIVSFDLSATSIDTSNIIDFALLQDSDGDFSDANAHTAGVTITNDIVRFTGVDFSDGDYFTLATKGPDPGPGGVAGDLTMWLRGDQGVTGSNPVTAWNDQSDQGNHVDDSSTSDPQLFNTAMNFNPAIHFDGGDRINEESTFINGYSSYTFITITKSDVTGVDRGFMDTDLTESDEEALGFRYDASGAASSRTNTIKFGVAGSGDGSFEVDEDNIQTTNPQMMAIAWDGGTPDFHLDGSQKTLVQASSPGSSISGADRMYIGNNAIGSGTKDWKGYIGEMILYNAKLSSSDLNKVQSYLALKYALTISATDYVDSAGAQLWDGDSSESSYHNDVAGIGQDSNSDFDQRVAKSTSTDGIVAIATTSDFASANSDSSRTSLGSGNFLVWGNNNGAAAWTTGGGVDRFKRLSREWRVRETGSVGNVHIQVDVGDPDFDVPEFVGNLQFLHDSDNDGSFADETPQEMIDAGGNKWTISGIDFDDGEEFTFATRAKRRVIVVE